MSKNRMINTKFWSDGWIINLDPLERYLFIYFLTNEHTNICGIYELPIRVIARESGIDDEMIRKMLKKLSDKILYIDGWIYIKNFLKHQKSSGNIKVGIENGLKEVPKEIMDKINKVSLYKPKSKHTPLCPKHSPILESESEFESELEVSATKDKKQIDFLINEFKPINPTINFGNITERKSIKEMLKQFGYEKLLGTIKFAVSVQGQQYAPVITTPYQLKANMGKLMVYYQKENNKKPIII